MSLSRRAALLALAGLALWAAPLEAANHYIRDGGTASTAGTGGCTDTGWATAQACDTFPATLVRGDTYYVASGTYGGRLFSTTGTTLTTIKKATDSDHGTDTGWQASFATGQAVFNGEIEFSTSFWVFDGITGGGPLSWTSGHGFKVARTALSDGQAVSIRDGVTNITMRHVEIQGHGPDHPNGNGQDGLNILTGSDHRFSYMYIHDMGRTIIFNRSHNLIFEYSYTGAFESTSNAPGCLANASNEEHGEIASIWIDFAQTLVQNVVFRYNLFTHGGSPCSTGGILCNCNNMQVYGNVFAPVNGGTLGDISNGLVAIWSGDTQTNSKVYNNTFINAPVHVFGDYNANDSIEARNNLFYISQVGNGSGGYQGAAAFTHTHNHYVQITDGPVSEATQTTGSSNPFAAPGWQNLSFGLASNTSPGTTLTGPSGCTAGVNCYNVDMFGNARSTWTRGAIEFGGAPPVDTTPPSAPTNLQATAAGISQINLTWTAATDDVGVTAYRVERCQGAGCVNFAEIAQPTATSYNDTGLSAATLYRYRVRAQDAANNLGNYSSIAQATTDSIVTPPTAPSNLRIAYAEVP